MKNALPLMLLFVSSAGCLGQISGSGANGAGGQETVDPGSGSTAGSGGMGAVRGGSGGARGDAGPTAASGLPCEIRALLADHCLSCHGAVPLMGVPASLVTYDDLMAPSKSNPSMTVAELALVRIQATTLPMPPAPAARTSAAEIAAMQS